MPRPVDPASLSCKHPSVHKPYFSYHVPSTQLRSHASTLWPTNLIFHTNFLSSCHVPSTQLRSHASTLRAHKPYFSYHFFERMPRPFDPASFLCKCPSVHKPYFSYHVPSTQLCSHASTLRPTNLIFHTIFSSAYHVPSTQVHSHISVH